MLTYLHLETDQYSPVLGAFFGVSLLMTIVFLDRVQGQASRIQDFLADREWHILKSDAAIAHINFMLKISCWVFFTLPLITLIIWGSGVIARLEDDDQKATGGIAILIVGFGLIFLLYGVFNIKWNRYRLSLRSSISIILSLILFTAYKVVAIFNDDDESFFGISVIFLTANCLIMIVIAFLNNPKGGLNIHEVVDQLPEGEALDVNRDVNFDDEITQAYTLDEYIPTQSEIYEIFTISAVSKEKGLRGAFEGGLGKSFLSMSPVKKWTVTLSLYAVALIILGLYAMLDYTVRDESGIGIITIIAVIVTDVILYLYIHAKIAQNPAEISLHLIVFRVCMFILGGDHWIYGYCIMYLYVGIFLSHHITRKRFPFLEQVIEDSIEADDRRSSYNLASSPEFLLLLSTVMFALIMGVMQAIQPDDVPLNDYTVENENYPFWAFGLFSALFVLLVLFSLIVFRIYIRRRTGVESRVYTYIHFKEYDMLYFFLTIDYLVVCLIAILLWWATTDERYVIVGILAPLALCFCINSYLKFTRNDYRYFQNISKINRYINKHNKHIDSITKRVKNYKRQIASKTGKNVKDMTLTAEEIAELSKKKLKYNDEVSDDDERLEDIDEGEEESKVIDNRNNQPVPNDDEEEDDEMVEEGGDDSKEQDGERFGGNRQKSSVVPRSGDRVFRSGTFKDNLFGRIASMIIHDEEISYDGDYTDQVKATKRFKKLKDWRNTNNVCSAFF